MRDSHVRLSATKKVKLFLWLKNFGKFKIIYFIYLRLNCAEISLTWSLQCVRKTDNGNLVLAIKYQNFQWVLAEWRLPDFLNQSDFQTKFTIMLSGTRNRWNLVSKIFLSLENAYLIFSLYFHHLKAPKGSNMGDGEGWEPFKFSQCCSTVVIAPQI